MKVISLITFVLGLFLAPYLSQAQPVAKTPRIGILTDIEQVCEVEKLFILL